MAAGTIEKGESGGYQLVPREQLNPGQLAWLDLSLLVEENGGFDGLDPMVVRKLLQAWIQVAPDEELDEFLAHLPARGRA